MNIAEIDNVISSIIPYNTRKKSGGAKPPVTSSTVIYPLKMAVLKVDLR